MNIVIDTNLFISALIKDSLTRYLLTNLKHNFIFPEFEFNEIYNHKGEIVRKAGFSEKEFNTLVLRLIKYVKIIPSEVVKYKKEAEEIIRHIDKDDAVFIATALTFDTMVWSDDKHFKKQKKIKVLSTGEIIRLLE